MENNFDNLLIDDDYIVEREQVQNNIITINDTITDISNGNLTNEINSSMELFTVNSNLINQQIQEIETIINESLFTEVSEFYNNYIEDINNINDILLCIDTIQM